MLAVGNTVAVGARAVDRSVVRHFVASFIGELTLRCASVSERRHVKAYVYGLLAGCLVKSSSRVDDLERLADNFSHLEQDTFHLQTLLNVGLTGAGLAVLTYRRPAEARHKDRSRERRRTASGGEKDSRRERRGDHHRSDDRSRRGEEHRRSTKSASASAGGVALVDRDRRGEARKQDRRDDREDARREKHRERREYRSETE
ncbi:unnamed protein product, partial [Prorocentrum cordatum]